MRNRDGEELARTASEVCQAAERTVAKSSSLRKHNRELRDQMKLLKGQQRDGRAEARRHNLLLNPHLKLNKAA